MIVDFVNAPELRPANARRARNWQPGLPIQPHFEHFQVLGNRRIPFSHVWKGGANLQRDYTSFAHFCTPTKTHAYWAIHFQQDHRPHPATPSWTNGMKALDGP